MGKLSDEKKTVRMVSFEPKLRATVEKASESGEAVAVANCSVQESNKEGFDGMEIVTDMRTTALKSPQKFSIGDDVRSEASSLSGSVDVLAIEWACCQSACKCDGEIPVSATSGKGGGQTSWWNTNKARFCDCRLYQVLSKVLLGKRRWCIGAWLQL